MTIADLAAAIKGVPRDAYVLIATPYARCRCAWWRLYTSPSMTVRWSSTRRRSGLASSSRQRANPRSPPSLRVTGAMVCGCHFRIALRLAIKRFV